jgi:uncharacterized membrane protein YqjE
MRTERFQPNPRHLIALRLGVTIVALSLLAGSVLLVWLIDDRDAALIITLAAILVGWVVTLILAKPSAESPTQITNFDDDNSPSLSLY